MRANLAQVSPEEAVSHRREVIRMHWLDREDGSRIPAGAAFYDEDYGEYRLKIDIHPEVMFFLRAVSHRDAGTEYLAEVVVMQNGKFKCRRPVGTGESGPGNERGIFVRLGPYKRILVLEE